MKRNSNKNCFIFIIDSKNNFHKIKGDNSKVFSYLYQFDLFRKVETRKDFEKEKKAINKLKSFYKTSIINSHNKQISKPLNIISTGSHNEAGTIFVDKPNNQIFYCQKPDDVFFYCDFRTFKNMIKNSKSADDIKNLSLNQIKNIKITHYPYNEKEKTHQFNSIMEIKQFLENERIFKDFLGCCFYIPIDWNNLGYDFKIYNGNSPEQFQQLAFDLAMFDIELTEKEENIWCNKLISLFVNSHNFKLSKDEIRQNFHKQLKAYKEYSKFSNINHSKQYIKTDFKSKKIL